MKSQSTKKRPYVGPQVTSFSLEERFTNLTHLVSALGADVRRAEAQVQRAALERRGERLLVQAHSLLCSLLRDGRKGLIAREAVSDLATALDFHLQEARS